MSLFVAFEVYESEEQLSLVMECMQGGELFDRVVQRKRFTEKDASRAVYQTLGQVLFFQDQVGFLVSNSAAIPNISVFSFMFNAKDAVGGELYPLA